MVLVEKLNFVDIMFKYFRLDWDRRNNLEETMINLLHETELKELAHRALDQNNGLDGYIYETLLKDDRANQLRDFVIGLLSKDENEELIITMLSYSR